MYTIALAESRINCSGKIVLKLGFVLMALAVFSNPNLPINAYDSGSVLKGYIQENTIYKEHDDNALFLLKEKWNEEIQEKYAGNKIQVIDDGVIYISMVKYINSRRVKINIAEINRNINPNLEIIPEMSSDKMHSKAGINAIAKKSDTLIAINGTYFKQDTGTPLGALVIDNEIIAGPIYERAGFGITSETFKTSRIKFEGSLKKGNKTIKIDNINQPRMMFSEVLIYTSKWGAKSPLTKKPAIHIAIKDNKIIQKANHPLLIPKDGYVISAPNEKIAGFKLEDTVEIDYKLSPQWQDTKHIISGGPYLLKEGNIYIDAPSEKLTSIAGRNPRTAIGYTKDNVMIMVTVDGRKEGSSGMTLNELASLMKNLDCYEAINLDGGSSTVMYVDGKILTGSNLRNSAAISNAIIVKRAA